MKEGGRGLVEEGEEIFDWGGGGGGGGGKFTGGGGRLLS